MSAFTGRIEAENYGVLPTGENYTASTALGFSDRVSASGLGGCKRGRETRQKGGNLVCQEPRALSVAKRQILKNNTADDLWIRSVLHLFCSGQVCMPERKLRYQCGGVI